MSDKFELIHALVDGQLTGEEFEKAQALLESDPECQMEYQWATKIKANAAAQCRVTPDQTAWNKALQQMDEIDRSQKINRFVSKYAWAFCALVLATILFGAVNTRTTGSQTLAREHVAELFSPGALKSPSSSNSVTSDSMLDLRPYSITAVADGIVADRPCRYLRLRDQVGSLALLAVSGVQGLEGIDTPTGIRGFKSGEVNGAKCVTWTMKGTTFVLSSNRPTTELIDLAQYMISN